MVDPHTFGGSKASENLADILENHYPRLIPKVSRYAWNHRYAGLASLMALHKEKKLAQVQDSNLPEEVKSHLLNVMCVVYHEKLKVIKSMHEHNAPKSDRRDFEIGQKVKLLYDVKDDYMETYIPKGSVVKIEGFRKLKEYLYIYKLPYGFWVGKDWLEKVK